MPPVTLTWYDGGYEPRLSKGFNLGKSPRDDFHRIAGTLMEHRLVPESAMQSYDRPPRVLPRSPDNTRSGLTPVEGGAGCRF